MLVGNTLCEFPGANVRLKLRVIVASAVTASPCRSISMTFPGHLDEPFYLFYEPLDRLCDECFPIHRIFNYWATDMIWIIWIVDLSAERAIRSAAAAPIENRNTRSDLAYTICHETFADSQLRIWRSSNLHASSVRARSTERIVSPKSLLNIWRVT